MHSEIATPNPWSMAPFGVLLGMMALAPVLAPGWWTRHYAKVALGLGAVTLADYLTMRHALAAIGHTAHEYLGFVALVGGLYVVTGGIHIDIKTSGKPLGNAVFLLAGAVLANVLGTTGVAMLLIRPWIRLNQKRIRPYHLIFFIFLVANVGGSLTPIGDPPLFLGYLQGVPFWWVAAHCWPMWAVGTGLLVAIFYVTDVYHYQHAAKEAKMGYESWRIVSGGNLFFLAVILGAVFINHPMFLREGLMLAAAAGSWWTTKKSIHEANRFNFHPVQEVAIVFAGIFATMMPAMTWLEAHSSDLMGQSPSLGVFYWGTGLLSSLLDNAPTYLAFFSGLVGITRTDDVPTLLHQHGVIVAAISVGAVFFGAATYIGNGPNFLVKSIAEQEKIPMPSFLGMVFRYSLPILAPILVIVWLLFFHSYYVLKT